jgi:glycosyltransferase involved in cell wall biosynthesis
VGLRTVPGIDLSKQSTWIVNRGNFSGALKELSFRALGPNRSQLHELKELHGKLLHAHFALDACDALDLARLLNTPLICTCHGYDVTTTDTFHKKDWHGRLFVHRKLRLQREASVFIAVSRFIRQKMLEQGYPEHRIRVHYIGVDTQFFHPPAHPARKLQVLFVGRLAEKKGCSYLIDAMAAVQIRLPEAELIIIGDGPHRADLEAKAAQVLRKFRFLGKQSPNEIKKWMQTASVFSVPSITATSGDAEGFGIVFAEAQACGLPVVSFLHGGIPEAVEHGKTGFLVDERDADGLASGLLTLLANSALRDQMGRNGRARVEKHFNLRKQSLLLEDIYDEVCSDFANELAS